MNERYDFPQWEFYRSLERDLEKCFDYVDPDPAHFNVHSNRFARIILLSCIEIENAFNFFGPPPRGGVLGHYFPIITGRFPKFCLHRFVLPRYKISSNPWESWKLDSSPLWWSDSYNKIKHARTANPACATMKHAIDALCALQCLLIHSYRKEYGDWVMPMEMAPVLAWPLHPKHERIWRPMMVWSPPLADDPEET